MTITNIQDVLVLNNRFANVKISAEQISAESFSNWRGLISDLHRAAYKVYAICENNGMKAESDTVDKSGVFDVLRYILGVIGDVNEHKLYANAESVIAIISYAGKRANVDAPELQLVKSRIANAKKELRLAESLNGLDPNYVSGLQSEIERLEDEKFALMSEPDMCYKRPTMTTENAFRMDVEHFLARIITGQLAKTLEELDAEAEERRATRKAAAKARKAAKNTTK